MKWVITLSVLFVVKISLTSFLEGTGCGRGFDNCYYLEDPVDGDDEHTGSVVQAEPRHWNHHHEYREMDVDFNDPTGPLDDATAWPGLREDYSDTIFRDNDPAYRDR